MFIRKNNTNSENSSVMYKLGNSDAGSIIKRMDDSDAGSVMMYVDLKTEESYIHKIQSSMGNNNSVLEQKIKENLENDRSKHESKKLNNDIKYEEDFMDIENK